MRAREKITHVDRWLCLVAARAGCLARADGPADNRVDKVRPVPPPGVTARRTTIARRFRTVSTNWPSRSTRLRDVAQGESRACWRSCQMCRSMKRPSAGRLPITSSSTSGKSRPRRNCSSRAWRAPGSCGEGKAPWNTATGLVVRGYVSKIDGSVQPYGLVVPASYQPNSPHHFRLDVWCHGRGETLSELNFINGRQSSPRRVHAAERVRPASLRPLLQRQQVRRRDRSLRGDRRHQETLPDRRRPPGDAGLLDGRSGVLAVRRPLSELWAAAAPGPASPRPPTSSRSSRTRRFSRPGTRKSYGIFMTAPTTPSTCSTARPWPIAARTIARSRPPT